jgi:hypothetical protein
VTHLRRFAQRAGVGSDQLARPPARPRRPDEGDAATSSERWRSPGVMAVVPPGRASASTAGRIWC